MGENEIDKEQLIRLAAAMEMLTATVRELTGKFETMRDERVVEMEKAAAVMEEKVSRLSWIVYGVVGAFSMETLAVIGAVIVWAITKS